ncbi:MAG: class I SAM-dependent methyltransferase [Myxococcota bacterium]
MGFYEKHVFPHLMDLGMRQFKNLRAQAVADAHGDVLEIGFGTGLNLPHYPSAVKRIFAVDPIDSLRARIERRIERAGFPVERLPLAADGGLPFEDDRFDCVTMTWTLCSIGDPAAALAEMRRVLRPGGPLLFIEHGRSDDERIARWQRRLNPIQRRIGCGCHLDRPIDELIRRAGFGIVELDRFVASKRSRIFTEMYRGVARA